MQPYVQRRAQLQGGDLCQRLVEDLCIETSVECDSAFGNKALSQLRAKDCRIRMR